MRTLSTPTLVLHGTADEVCKPENLERVWPEWAEPKRLVRVPDAGHFFDRQLAALAEALLQGLR